MYDHTEHSPSQDTPEVIWLEFMNLNVTLEQDLECHHVQGPLSQAGWLGKVQLLTTEDDIRS